MNIIKKILDTSAPAAVTGMDELVTITSAQFFLKRSPSSPKGELECICNDCVASVRKTTVPFNYQIIIQKAYQEDELDNDDDFEDKDGDEFDSALKDEWEFLIDEALAFETDKQDGYSVSWRELTGDYGDRFQLVVDAKQVKAKTFDLFVNTIYRCEYERKYNVDSDEVADDVLVAEFGNGNSRQADDLYKQLDKGLSLKAKAQNSDDDDSEDDFHDAIEGLPAKGDIVYKETAALFVFDASELSFKKKDNGAVASVIDHGNFTYTLSISAAGTISNFSVSNGMNPVFDFDQFSFVFNAVDEGKSFLLKFQNFGQLDEFQEAFKIALWEAANRIKWLKVNPDEKEYILSDTGELVPEISSDADEEESSDDEEEEEEERPSRTNLRFGKQKLFVDEDDDRDEEELAKREYLKSSRDANTNLAVGFNKNRAFVSRGSTIGVFKEDDQDDELKFHVAIKNVKAPDSKRTFNPSKMMLHMQDSSMILQDPTSQGHLYRMDLERGVVVDDYYVKDGVNVVDFNPASKLAQLTNEQTFVGVSGQGLFRIDPRLSGDKIVDKEHKSYATKSDFSTIATTDSGHLAVASKKGDIRLFDRLGINAKTALPALDEPIIGLDVSKDGRWVLATCVTHLLLVDTTIKDGKNAGSSGFEKSFGRDTKPRPMRLTLTPAHVAYMVSEKTPLSFTKAYFNIDPANKEQTIVTSSGPYVVTWSLKDLVKKDKSYKIKKYGSSVVSDNFKFGDDKKVILALKDDVTMASKKSFKKPTKETLGFGSVVKEYY